MKPKAVSDSEAMKALGYCRRSKESTERTVSLQDQRARIEGYAAVQGWTLIDMLTDDWISGGKRARLDRLDAALRQTGARAVVVYHLDRFARDVAALLETLRAYTRKGVELHVVDRGRIDVGTASGFLMTGVEGLMAEHFRRLIGEKTRDALAMLRSQGRRYTRVPPYGFTVATSGELVHDRREQTVLRAIAALAGAGLSLRATSRRLAEQGVLARNGRPFEARTLSRVLRRVQVVANRPIGHRLVS